MKKIISDGKTELQFINSLHNREDEFDVTESVKEILSRVKREGDSAVIEFSKKFDGVDCIRRLDKSALKAAAEKISSPFKTALENAAKNIEAYHKKQLREGYLLQEEGIMLGQVIRPLKRVGIYVPGGTASYPSSVLMNAIPAKIAGVKEVVMVTPPPRFEGQSDDIILAASVAGVDEIIFAGGAQAVAALAYGTESITRVDKIIGPGNIFVATAKRLVFGVCDIDMIAGPSEILVVADSTARADFVAADMLSQAEHDERSSSVLLTTSEILADEVAAQLEIQLEGLSRKEICRKSLENYGGIIICKNLAEMTRLANLIAPEHLELMIENAFEHVLEFENAGSIFLGNYSPEPLGDYFAGTNHVLPTSGTARFSSPLSVDDFLKKYSYIQYDKEALQKVSDQIEIIARREGLTAHENSIRIRKK